MSLRGHQEWLEAPYQSQWLDDDSPESHTGMAKVWRSGFSTARKPHHCDGCDGQIKPGELYEYAVGLSYSGEFTIFKTCCTYIG